MRGTGAVCFDFNGTLSLDEEVMYELLAALLADRGRPLPRETYFGEFIGLADDEIATRWLGVDAADARAVAAERAERYRRLPPDGRIPAAAAAAVRAAAARVPVAVVTTSLRGEVEPVLAAAGLGGLVSAIVTGDDVLRPKPDPEPYRRALELLGAPDGLAFEDTPPGVASAKRAGLRCCGIVGTVGRDRLCEADVVADALTPELVESLL